jgi:NADH-quinone oxidoreductase subunit C
MTALAFEAMAELVRARFPAVQPQKSDNGQPFLLVPPADLPGVAAFVRDARELRCDAVMDLTGYDLLKYPRTPPSDAIAVVYLLFSYQHRHKLTLKVYAPRSACAVGTVSKLWPAALYFEREVWDLLGVQFTGHPSLRRIMTPEDWEGHPLRKDYEYPQGYHGVAHLREGQHFESAPRRQGDPPPVPAAAAKKAPSA